MIARLPPSQPDDAIMLCVNNILIRQATEADVSSICQLQQQWAQEDSAYGFVAETQEHIRAALGSFLAVAEVKGIVVGFVAGSVHVSEGTAVIPAGASYIEIDNLYVMAHFRKQGIGSSLIKHVLAVAKGQGVTHALLYSSMKDLHRVIKFYEHHDFQSWYIQMFREL